LGDRKEMYPVKNQFPLISIGTVLEQVEKDPKETADPGSPGKTAIKRSSSGNVVISFFIVMHEYISYMLLKSCA